MPSQMLSKDTTWNQHGSVGATLLANWVEERAVGADRIIQERNVPYISRHGHSNILEHGSSDDKSKKFSTVSKLSYQTPTSTLLNPFPNHIGVLKTMKHKKWMDQAAATLQNSPQMQKDVKHPAIYTSTTMSANNHVHPGFIPSLSHDQVPPCLVQSDSISLDESDSPITFYTDHVQRQTNHIYSSTPQQGTKVTTFGRHTKFSTPIRETLSAPNKP